MPAKVFLATRIGGGFHVGCVSSKIEKRVLKNPVRMIAAGELSDRVVDVLIGFVLEFQSHNRQAVQEEHKIHFLVGLIEIEMGSEGNAIVGILRSGGTRCRTRLGIKQPELQASHFQTLAEKYPQRSMFEFLSQGFEDLLPSIRAVVVFQFLQCVRLRSDEKLPEFFFGDAVLGIRNLSLFQLTELVNSFQVIGDMLPKRQLRRFS